MATPEAQQQKLEEAQKLLTELSDTDPATLARTEELSRDINFENAVPAFAQMLDIVRQLSNREIDRLSTSQLNSIHSACKVVKNLIEKVRGFTLNQNTPKDVCESIIQEIQNSYDSVIDPLIVPLSFTATQATDYSRIEREAKGYHANLKEEHRKLLSFVENAREEASSALEAVREQAAEAGVASNAQIFQLSAKELKATARIWMWSTIVASLITLAIAGSFLWLSFNYQPETTAAAIQYVVAKFFVLSTLTFAIYWCAREYKSLKHNETVNRHRANALLTFRAFIEGASDERVKDAVLLHAAQAAFTGRPTGYNWGGKQNDPINPVVEVLGRGLAKPGADE